MVTISKFSYENPRFNHLLKRRSSIPEEVETTVREVLKDVKTRGDEALYEYMKKFDHVDMNEIGLFVTEEEFADAREKVSEEFKESVKRACDNLMRFHKKQLPVSFSETYQDGAVLERRYTPINSLAINVPGNMAPLVSTLYMNVIPAIVAGVPNIYILTKPRIDGTIDEHLLYVADYLNIRNYYKISGSQGLAAVAYGTETVRKVDAITGPGNNFTQMAKKLLFGEVKIDSIAGPSEIAIIADRNANPVFIAADMMSQAEHGTGFEASTAFCLSEEQAQKIKAEINRLCKEHGLVKATQKTFENYGDIFIVDSIEEAVDAVNEIAPEHAELLLDDYQDALTKLTNAGAVFVGEYSTEPVGDYFCGTNHILPTCGTAKFSSGMSVLEFMRGYSVIHYPEAALKQNADHIIQLAESEGMKAHALAVKIRK
ncbi:histidinol dehydrogenase [Muricomes sp. OA1]|uniref:histidinol dehydrogenase n=1 Tax=Hungatella hathewayi TaxID=154046 RepID=A0A3E2WAU8_9FIRM|nr:MULTISPECIES: histidinol dehydrogenase [Clostridia]MCH1974810.1 histidinol dehydrogenase [Muricomes sp. OA1]MRM91337.1 histidinol dehydrogenase [Faecalicatena contorta]RGC22428.1 histidinol dehydrogenase [Hungatella hathewayi]GKH33600.1 histidinol dehydrogenase [Faecalicatena contorta]